MSSIIAAMSASVDSPIAVHVGRRDVRGGSVHAQQHVRKRPDVGNIDRAVHVDIPAYNQRNGCELLARDRRQVGRQA